MPVEWSVDPTTKSIRVRLTGSPAEPEWIALIRNVAMVTAPVGGHSILVDMRGLETFPEYRSSLRIAQTVADLEPPPVPDRIVFIGAREGAPCGKTRQFVSMLVALGVDKAEFHTEEPSLPARA